MKLLARIVPLFAAAAVCAVAQEIKVDVDAREISRSLLHARIDLPASAVVWYPKWIPGVHAPGGPVQNLAGLRFETPKGDPITWRRDDEEQQKFHLALPAGVDRVVAHLDYICNQPSVNSSGIDSFGNSLVGVINWNTVLLYPENATIDAATARVSLRLPPEWRFGTALKPEKESPEVIAFAPLSLRQVVDSPLICGKYFRDFDLKGKQTPPVVLHVTSESPNAIQFDEKLIARYRALVAEALSLFGVAHFQEYHFLLVCSDTLPNNGLEHLASSYNSVGEREIIDEKKRKHWPAYLLPHEFVHSWCGKYRRPASMLTKNFHTPERTHLLWVYEGLTQYLGEILTVRAGLLSYEDFVPQFASKLDWLMRQSGRKWRSLEDTAISAWLLRGRSPYWASLRRSQDYYDEGLLTWMEADATIRERTGGKKSIDDFCKKFFAAQPNAPVVAGYELDEVIRHLNDVAPMDWKKFFQERIAVPRQELGLDFLQTLGYKLQYTATPSEYQKERDQNRKTTTANGSLGIAVADDGKISTVIPGMPGDKAGLASAMTIIAVNGRKFSGQRLRDAIEDSVAKRSVELLVFDGDLYRTVALEYADGPKYLELVRRNDRTDLLGAMVKPTVKE